MEKITMGSLRMDKGENVHYLREQISRMSEQRVKAYFFDIICLPDQFVEATKNLVELQNLLYEYMPWIANEDKFFGITFDEEVRPAAMALILMSQGKEILMMDLNPERE